MVEELVPLSIAGMSKLESFTSSIFSLLRFITQCYAFLQVSGRSIVISCRLLRLDICPLSYVCLQAPASLLGSSLYQSSRTSFLFLCLTLTSAFTSGCTSLMTPSFFYSNQFSVLPDVPKLSQTSQVTCHTVFAFRIRHFLQEVHDCSAV